jgi:zearalenone synthase (highly reducing iterative type I polyketide synthase)
MAFATKLAKLLIMDRGDLQLGVPVYAYGVDSLVVIELREWFRKAIRSDVVVFDIQGNMSVADLAKKAAKRRKLVRILLLFL